MATETRSEQLQSLLERLLRKNVQSHREALDELATVGDRRIIPHLVEIAQLDAIANNWDRFGHPELLRERHTPYPLDHPETRWPGVIETLCAIAAPDFDSEVAWLRWETWATQQDIDPLEGYMDWKIRLYRAFHPMVGHVLDTEPRMDEETFRYVRGGIADPSTLHPLNDGTFRPADDDEYVGSDDVVYGFTVDGQAYAVPRWIILPHEGLNTTIQDVPLSLSYCPLCDAALLFEREIDGQRLTLGCSGLLLHGNKIMYDDETASLWAQVTGQPLAGEALANDWTLTKRPIDETTWQDWVRKHPETQILDRDTGYDWDYEWYQDYNGYMKRHYWDRDDILLPGLERNQTPIDDTDHVFALQAGEDTVRVYPVNFVHDSEPLVDTVADRDVVVIRRGRGVAAYEAPPAPVDREGDTLVDGDGSTWEIEQERLVGADRTLDRVTGNAGMWWAIRPKFETLDILGVE